MKELLGGTVENSVSPTRGHLICPLGQSMIFYKKETEKNELVSRPGAPRVMEGHLQSDELKDLSVSLLLVIEA